MFDLFHKDESTENQAEKKLKVNLHRCPQSHACPSVRICPTGALQQRGFQAPTVDDAKCIKCGKCVKLCPMHALTLQ